MCWALGENQSVCNNGVSLIGKGCAHAPKRQDFPLHNELEGSIQATLIMWKGFGFCFFSPASCGLFSEFGQARFIGKTITKI